MEMAMQLIPNGKCLESNTIHVLKDFNPQSLATQAEKKGASSFREAIYYKEIFV